MSSIFDTIEDEAESHQMFFDPGGFSDETQKETMSAQQDFAVLSDWDLATRYHELARKEKDPNKIKRFRTSSARAVLEKAIPLLGSVSKPEYSQVFQISDASQWSPNFEADLDLTLEDSGGKLPQSVEDFWYEESHHRSQPVVLCVDTSLSMTGEKLALTAVAIAVVLLQFKDDPIGIVAFESEATILKRFDQKQTILQTIENFLDVPAEGYTDLEAGLKGALKVHTLLDSQSSRRAISTLLLTDGKYTAGRNPLYLASSFEHLVVLKMGAEKSALLLCKDLATQGNGSLIEVPVLEAIPSVMYGVVRDLLRGRNLS